MRAGLETQLKLCEQIDRCDFATTLRYSSHLQSKSTVLQKMSQKRRLLHLDLVLAQDYPSGRP